jgi:WD40 repeat protein
MTEFSGSVATAKPKMAQKHKWRRRGRVIVIVIFAGTLLWFGAALYQRLTYTWQLTHVIRGFVAYGSHETEFSPDGTRIAIAHAESSKVLDWIHGNEITRLEQYGGRGISDFSSDGKIVSRFPDGKAVDREAYIWNASDGRVLGRVRLPKPVEAERCYPFFSPDNKKIVAACADGLVTWDSSDLNDIGRIKITQNQDAWFSTFMSWHPVTHEMTGVDADGKLLKIDLQKQTVEPLLAKQERAVKAAKWSPDGTRLVTIDREDGVVLVWDVPAGNVAAKLPEKDVVYSCFSPDGERIVTKAKRSDVVHTEKGTPFVWDRRTRIWDAKSGKMIQELPTTAIVTLSPDWSFWVDAGPEGVRIARFDGSEACTYSGMFDGHGSMCVFSQDNRHLARVNASGLVDVLRHNDPIRSWTEWLTLYEFWMTVLAVAGLAWSAWRSRASKGKCKSAF